MTREKRKFTIEGGPRGRLPLKIILIAPPGKGKTKSAIELATGMARVSGKRVAVGDTEYPRSRFYLGADAGGYSFDPIPIEAPYTPSVVRDFLEEYESSHVCVVDTLSDFHEGEGGACALVTRMIEARGEKYSSLAWMHVKTRQIQPLRNFLQTWTGDCVLTVRAKPEFVTTKRKELIWETVCGYEFLFVSTANIVMLDPGVPMLESSRVVNEMMVKVPGPLRPILEGSRALSSATGERLARWAMGDEPNNAVIAGEQEHTRLLDEIRAAVRERGLSPRNDASAFDAEIERCFGCAPDRLPHLENSDLEVGLEMLRTPDGLDPAVPESDVRLALDALEAADVVKYPVIAKTIAAYSVSLTTSQRERLALAAKNARLRLGIDTQQEV